MCSVRGRKLWLEKLSGKAHVGEMDIDGRRG
jgi:hypothetical protein